GLVAVGWIGRLALIHGHERRCDHRRRALAIAFVRAEVEHAIADDGASEEGAVALFAERRLARALRLRERVLRVERIVAMEREEPALDLIGARTRDDADDRAGGQAELGRELVRHDGELADGLEGEAAALAGGDDLIVADAVDHVAVAARGL